MSNDVQTWVVLVALGLLLLVFPGLRWWAVDRRSRKLQRVLREDITGEACVACGSGQIDEYEPACYRCQACGFSWGQGWRARADRQRRAALVRMTAAQRRAEAIAALREAASLLDSASAYLKTGPKQLPYDLLLGRYGDMYSQERNEAVVKALADAQLAWQQIQYAAAADAQVGAPGAQLDWNIRIAALDAAVGSWEMDLVAHHELQRLLGQITAMQSHLEGTLAALHARARCK